MHLVKTTGRRGDFLLNAISPLLCGVFLYVVGDNSFLPRVFKNHIADGLWAYAFASCLLIIWQRNIPGLWTVMAFVSAVLFEVLQYGMIVPGTGDVYDVLAYFLFFLLALLSNSFFKKLY